jgi:hypothetical protein
MSEPLYDRLKAKAGDLLQKITRFFRAPLKSKANILDALKKFAKELGLPPGDFGEYQRCTLPSRLDQRKFPERCKRFLREGYGANFSPGLDVELVALWGKNFTWGELAGVILNHLEL